MERIRQSNKKVEILIDNLWILEDFTLEDVKAGQTFKLDGQELVAQEDGYIDPKNHLPSINCRAPYPDAYEQDGFQPTPADQVCTKCREVADALHDETDCERCDQPWWFRTTPEFMENRTPCPTSDESWDTVFLSVARSVANLSKCASRQFGAVIVKDRRIISTGFNGAPTRTTLCQKTEATCPRQLLGLKSGKGLDICPAQHAEANAIVNAARNGISTLNSTIYIVGNAGPCKSCAGAIINAGIVEVVFDGLTCYDDLAQILFDQAQVKLRPLMTSKT